jgi:hypothetical protein
MSPQEPAPPVPSAAAQRGFRHWTIIGIVTAVFILVFLLRR